MTTKLFIIRNQHGLYLSKQQEWVEGGDRNQLYRTVHRDEAINTVFEVSSRDIYLRAETLACDADARGNPLLNDAAVPADAAEAAAATDEAEVATTDEAVVAGQTADDASDTGITA